MSNKLKIYACSGIGSTDQRKPFVYYTDGTSTVSNTQAVNTILARINALYIEANMLRGLSNEKRLDLLCEVDAYSVALEAAKRYAGDNDQLYRAGQVIDLMIHDGLFEYDSTDDNKRNDHLDGLITKFYELMNDGQPIANENPTFAIWWNENIIARDRVGLDKESQEATKKALKKAVSGIKGIGTIDPNWQNDPNISNYLLNASEYFLYRYLKDEQIAKLPKIFQLKRNYQNRIYNYCKAYFVDIYGSESEMQSIIRAGIIKEFGNTPEQVCEVIVKTGKKPEQISGGVVVSAVIGTAELIKIITICAAVVIAIVGAICDCIYKSNVAKYASMERSIVDSGVPDSTDYGAAGLTPGGGSVRKKDSGATGIIAAFAGALLLLNN